MLSLEQLSQVSGVGSLIISIISIIVGSVALKKVSIINNEIKMITSGGTSNGKVGKQIIYNLYPTPRGVDKLLKDYGKK